MSHTLPEITHHRPRLPSFPTKDLLDSIASGAHYSGALQSQTDRPPLHARHWRARSHDRSTEHPEVEIKFKDVIDDLEQLYSCRPTLEILSRRFREDATLEHPLFRCLGLRDIASVAFSMPRFIVVQAERLSFRILSAGLSPNQLIYTQTQTYTLRLVGSKKEITSVVFVDLDDDMRIVQVLDRWNGEESASNRSVLRRLLVKAITWTIRMPNELHRASARTRSQ